MDSDLKVVQGMAEQVKDVKVEFFTLCIVIRKVVSIIYQKIY